MSATGAVHDIAGQIGAGAFSVGACAIDAPGGAISGPPLVHGPPVRVHIEPKVMSVLVVLASRAGEVVTRAQLIEAVWRVEYGGDESLTRAISILRRAFVEVGGGAGYIETIPKSGYRLTAPVRWQDAPPLADVTASGSAHDDASAGGSETRPPRALQALMKGPIGGSLTRGGAALLGGLLVLLVLTVALAWLGARLGDGGDLVGYGGGERVRVEPLSSDAAAQLAAPGLGERAAAVLAERLNAYDVPTVLALEGAPGGEADYVLGGALIETDGLLRAEVRLVQLGGGALVWSHTFERAAEDAELLIEQAAAQASYAVECGFFRRRLLREPIGSEVLAVIMRGCMHAVAQERVAHYEAALKLAEALPHEPAALSGSAFASIRLSDTPEGAQERERLRAYARSAAERALVLEPSFPEALLALAELEPYGSWAAREALILEAMDADRQYPWSRSQYGRLLRLTGRLEEAASAFDHTLALKRGANHMAERAWLLALTGETGTALRMFEQTEQQWPDNPLAPWRLFLMGAFGGDLDAALDLLDDARIARYLGQTGGAECWSAFLGMQRAAAGELAGLDGLCAGDLSGFHALRLAFLGEGERARAAARERLEGDDEQARLNMQMLLFYPAMAPARADPRFMELAETVGLARYWLESGRWPDFCAREALAYDCRRAAEAAGAPRSD